MRRLALLPLLALALAPAAAAAKPKPAHSWAQPQIQAVTDRGLLGGDANAFRPDDVLTQGELAELAAGLSGKPLVPAAAPAAPVTLAALDARLVNAAGLRDAASRFAATARTAGLAPPSRFGTEVVARLLGLRTNHPAARDAQELLPNDPVTRAEAAYSAARVLELQRAEVDAVREAAATFVLPALAESQRQVLRTAVSFVGYPYVWGGEFERRESPFGLQAQGGFDCSGFAWRVFKLQAYAAAPGLPGTLRGRTSMELSGEVPPAARIAPGELAAGDLVFFGPRGPKSKPAQVDHMGIALGNGWIVHSSSRGVAVVQLTGWYARRLAWGRRPLAEAGALR